MATSLPPLAPFPTADWRAQLVPSEWADCLDAWLALVEAHIALSEAQTPASSSRDESVSAFLSSFMRENAAAGTSILGPSDSAKALLKASFLLSSALLRSASPPSRLAQWDFLADVSRVYGRKRATVLLARLLGPAQELLDSSLSGLKKFLVKNMDAGIKGDLGAVEQRLDLANHLIHASPATAAYFLAGSDFLDALVSCFKVMNPPLRKVLIATTYLCLIGLAEGESPRISMLTDQLYALKEAAEAHKAGPINANDSLVPELVTATPLLQQLQHRLEASGSVPARVKSILDGLATFRKAGGMARPKRLVRRHIDKGKGLEGLNGSSEGREMHVHLMSQISQVQDLFPELGSGFISKLLDAFDDDPEQAIAHLLDGSLPSHLQDADRSENLYVQATQFYFLRLFSPLSPLCVSED